MVLLTSSTKLHYYLIHFLGTFILIKIHCTVNSSQKPFPFLQNISAQQNTKQHYVIWSHLLWLKCNAYMNQIVFNCKELCPWVWLCKSHMKGVLIKQMKHSRKLGGKNCKNGGISLFPPITMCLKWILDSKHPPGCFSSRDQWV